MKGTLIKGDYLRAEEDSSSFASLLHEDSDKIRRDVLMVLDPQDTSSGRLQAGITILYPGCRTKGHSHADREEVYYFTRGRGIMEADGEQWEVVAGDVFYVHPGPFHKTYNPHDLPLEYFWVTVDVK